MAVSFSTLPRLTCLFAALFLRVKATGGSSLSLAAPTLKSFCATQHSATGTSRTGDLDLPPAAERNLSKLVLCAPQVSTHLSSEMEKLSEG